MRMIFAICVSLLLVGACSAQYQSSFQQSSSSFSSQTTTGLGGQVFQFSDAPPIVVQQPVFVQPALFTPFVGFGFRGRVFDPFINVRVGRSFHGRIFGGHHVAGRGRIFHRR